jgi:hypothetical protein
MEVLEGHAKLFALKFMMRHQQMLSGTFASLEMFPEELWEKRTGKSQSQKLGVRKLRDAYKTFKCCKFYALSVI